MEIKKTTKLDAKENLIFLITDEKELSTSSFTKEELSFIKKELKNEQKQIEINRLSHTLFVILCEKENDYKTAEKIRISASILLNYLNTKKIASATLIGATEKTLPFIEGLALANYQFLKYYSDKKINSFKTISYFSEKPININEIETIVKATNYARDLVNEPLSFLTAVQLSKEIQKLGKEAGFKVEVFNKSKIEALKMGGLLAVNKGSIDPPTFSVMEWKPAKCKNKKPIILVGKGVVYDTGGLSLKPTPNSMDFMKCDMGGAAAVIGALYSIAKNKLPYHVIGLVPATDNRPGGNAYVPGDVITMHNKKTVEVLNTDAEGRLLLADALSYAQKYKPEIVIDIATLTGAAAAAIGHYGIVAMGNTDEKVMKKLKDAGNNVYERIVEFPFWDEYNEQLKSSIADITNLGNGMGGSITAGKFLENFTNYPYIHLDIAGPAYVKKPINYLTYGGTGVGVRLFYDFVKNY
ncbi:MAG: peptidase M17 [Bacteroidetes bacterium HGW-Bacteroidetes-12]|nr:MAG: peptidase M17 [Bacteroidetes bacterium HGW-Bacteroidetes-12]